jgi:hypothetical protein
MQLLKEYSSQVSLLCHSVGNNKPNHCNNNNRKVE